MTSAAKVRKTLREYYKITPDVYQYDIEGNL